MFNTHTAQNKFVKRPWDPSYNYSPEVWDRMETNRIAALRKKYRHSFPGTAPAIPTVPRPWQPPPQAPFVPILGTETNQASVSSVPGPWNASVSSVPGPWNGWRVPTMPNQPTPYSGYISLVPPTSQHPPALSNITNVATFRDPDRSPVLCGC